MLFKDNDGKYVIINKSDFVNDKDYYKQILLTKGHKYLSKYDNVLDNLLDIFQKKKEYITYKPKKSNDRDNI
tara:strand:+ start:4038 stop:4253 length:216 start_codon:yes stop_codon:yes gene_type:complete